jgi:hypothetical protein
MDEFGVELNCCNWMRGWAIQFFQTGKAGYYSQTQKLTMLIGIKPGDPRLLAIILGSMENPGRWIWVVQGTEPTI